MSALLETGLKGKGLAGAPVEADERLARAQLRQQIARLELELAGLLGEAFGRVEIDHRVEAAAREPRALGLGDLERVRDSLAGRISEARQLLRRRGEVETRNREELERMIASPAEHKWMRVTRHDVGEPGCGAWHVRPHLGPIGLLMGWWRVKVSSGCPLAGRLAAVELEAQARQAEAAATIPAR